MPQSNLQTWLDDYCATRSSIAGGVIMVASSAGARPALAAIWPRSAHPDSRLLAAASASIKQQALAVESGQPAPTKKYGNEGVISLPLRRRSDSIGAVAFQMHAANADSHAAAPIATAPTASATATSAPTASATSATATSAAPTPAAGTALTRQPPAAAAILNLHTKVLACDSLAAAAAAAAGGLATVLEYERVAIGMLERGYCRVIAQSSGMAGESGNALAQAIGRAMDEAVSQSTTLAIPAPPGSRARITLAHGELARRHDAAVCTIPLVRAGSIFGAVTLQRRRDQPLDAMAIERCEQFVSLIGPALDLMRANERPWLARLRDRLRASGAQPGPWLLAAILFAAVAGLWIPVDYWVGAPARLEGAIQRAVVAPADGFLKRAHVRPGDSVRAEQVLAEMMDQDLELEQRKLESEVAQHENAVRGALARGDRTLYATSAGRADAATAQLALNEEQRLRSRIRAPFDGVVIKGDLSQSLGAPVQRGEVLLVVAPAGQYRLIVEVDERDIPHLKPGLPGALSLSALPGTRLDFRVARITPLATARDGRNFFEVEGKLDALPASARPGLQGVAKIHVGERAFGWVWGHRAFDWARLKIWSLGG